MKPSAARLPARLLSRAGIRGLLLALLLPGIVLLLLLDSWNDYRTLADMTKDAYDRGLLEPALVLESGIDFDADGRLDLHTPVYAQSLLESRAGLRKYYRIAEIDPPVAPGGAVPGRGRLLAGVAELPGPAQWPQESGEPMLYDTVYRGEPLRAVAIVRDLYQRDLHRQVVVVVAESTGLRAAAEAQAWQQEFLRDARMLGLVVVLVWLGVAWALRPLMRLRNEVGQRSPRDLMPLDAGSVPSEVVPLVEAVNHHMARHRSMAAEQNQFLDDASHQLRTPVAIAMTQAEYALREPDPGRMRESLRAMVVQLTRARRLTEQLLALAHADRDAGEGGGAGLPAREILDLQAVAREAVLQYLPLAHDKRHDLGWAEATDAADEPAAGGAVPVRGNGAELHEVLSNLIHNAIHYCPPGSTITVSAGRDARCGWASVRDNGPGLDAALRERAFVRFDRAGMEGHGGGSGLGLAIARAYARRSGGGVELSDGDPNPQGGVGLCSTLRVPLA